MSQWFFYTLIAMLMWGFWGFFSKLATSVLRDTDAYIYELTGTLVVGLVMVFLLRFHPMYPLVTLLLSQLLLHESLSLKQALGIGLAIGAILLLST